MNDPTTRYDDELYLPDTPPPPLAGAFAPLPLHDPDLEQGIEMEALSSLSGSTMYSGKYASTDTTSKEAATVESIGLARRKLSRSTSSSRGITPSRTCWSAFQGKYQLLFMGLIFFQSAEVLTLIALIYSTIVKAIGDVAIIDTIRMTPYLETVTTYLALFSLAVVFEIFISIEGLIQKNIMQIAMLVPLQVSMTTYSVFLPHQLSRAIYQTSAGSQSVDHRIMVYGWAILATIGAITIGLTVCVWLLSEDFGWAILRWMGADLRTKRMYSLYQIELCLLKFDAFFFVGFAIQFLVLVSGSPLVERIITYTALPLIVVCLVVAAIALRYELKAIFYVFLFMQLAGLAYFGFKIFRIFTPGAVGERYQIDKNTLLTFAGISVVMLLATFFVSTLCLGNFGRGLKDQIPPYWSSKGIKDDDDFGGRMSLD